MPKRNPGFDRYIAEAAPFAQPILRHARRLVHAAGPDFEESFKWQFPSFLRDGKIVCMMAAFKAHSMFGFWHHGMDRILARELGRRSGGFRILGRITRVSDLPPEKAMLGYIRQAAALADSGTPGRSRAARKPKPEAKVPPDLAAALKKNKPAAATFAKFAPSQRRDYIEWITEAKRSETRQTRLATTLQWLAQGKPRNWKYLNC